MFTDQEIAQVYDAETKAPSYVIEDGHSPIKLVNLQLRRIDSNGKSTRRRTAAKPCNRSQIR